MNSFGFVALSLAWLFALTGIASGLLGGRFGNTRTILVARNATFLVSICTFLAIFSLGYLFFVSDFSNQYVWQFSNLDMPDIYRVSAIWGGMDGSMLLWCFFLSISTGILARNAVLYPRNLIPWVLAIANSSLLFFLTVTLFVTNPFRYIQAPFVPPDGNGLNPLLQNPYMAIHPPMLYAGFTTLAIPYAFCMGALLSQRDGDDWIRYARRWTLAGWSFLTAGICLGGYWAYIELGWGGFWAWDPVENSSFMPWLTATAYLHSVMVQERKEMLRFWNVSLIVLTYALTVFGTFLTRSGVVQSVHAFASTDVGWVFLAYLGLIFLVAALYLFLRRERLRSPRKIESFLSRESAFLINNLIFLSILFATFWGVMFPVFSEWLTGKKQAVGIPFFNAVNIPLFLLMLFLMGVGPLIAWKKASLQSLRKVFLFPLISGFVAGGALTWAGVQSVYAVISYSLCFFVSMTILGELHRGLRVQKATVPDSNLTSAASRLIRRNKPRYAGYLIHIGVLVAAIGVTASMAHKQEEEFTLALNEQLKIGRYSLELVSLKEVNTNNFTALRTLVSVHNENDLVTTLQPELRMYKRGRENTTEVALSRGLREDLYLVLAGLNEEGTRASFKVFINPLQAWLWIGVLIMLVGSMWLFVSLPNLRHQMMAIESRSTSREEKGTAAIS
ncbi:MAG: heme lyase CcmF/NrfE family subunit [Bdellovibrionales bacterium]|nr:heme lyase CcmF/NrfE family subunit [Bdellovibrionales bacterium]